MSSQYLAQSQRIDRSCALLVVGARKLTTRAGCDLADVPSRTISNVRFAEPVPTVAGGRCKQLVPAKIVFARGRAALINPDDLIPGARDHDVVIQRFRGRRGFLR